MSSYPNSLVPQDHSVNLQPQQATLPLSDLILLEQLASARGKEATELSRTLHNRAAKCFAASAEWDRLHCPEAAAMSRERAATLQVAI